MIVVAEITHSLLGTYHRTCGLVEVDVVKIFGNSVKITRNGQNREVAMCARVEGVMVTHVH